MGVEELLAGGSVYTQIWRQNVSRVLETVGQTYYQIELKQVGLVMVWL